MACLKPLPLFIYVNINIVGSESYMQNPNLGQQLINQEYIDNKEIIFNQYKLYVEMADKISERRANVNTFFLTANTLVLTVSCLDVFEIKKYILIITLLGVILSYTWYYLLQSYKLLNSGKFSVINEVEKTLPLNLYSYEWYKLGYGYEKEKYWPISHIEKQVPVTFGIFYVVILIFVILIGG